MGDASILTIILNFRTPELTLQAAETALREMDATGGEVVIIDNASGDGSLDQISQTARSRGWLTGGKLRVVASPVNGGFGAGMNIGFATQLSDGSTPEFYYLLNSDAFPEPGAVAQLWGFLKSHPKAGMAGSFVQGPDGTPHQTAFRFPSVSGEFEAGAYTGIVSRLFARSIVALETPATTTKVDWTAGASLLVRADMVRDIGGFDETFFLYFEETDLCHRAIRAGWETYYVPDSKVVHIGSVSTGMKEWSRTPSYWFDSRLHYFAKTHGRLYAGAATIARICGGLLWRARRIIQRRPAQDPKYFLSDLTRHGLRSMFGVRKTAVSGIPLTAATPEEPK